MKKPISNTFIKSILTIFAAISLLVTQFGIVYAEPVVQLQGKAPYLKVVSASHPSAEGLVSGLLFTRHAPLGGNASFFVPLPAQLTVVCLEANPSVEGESSFDGGDTPATEPESLPVESTVEDAPVQTVEQPALIDSVLPPEALEFTPVDETIVDNPETVVVPGGEETQINKAVLVGSVEASHPVESSLSAPVQSILSGEILIKFKADLTSAQQQELLASLGGNVLSENTALHYQTIHFAAGTEQTVIDFLEENGLVEWAQTNNTCQVMEDVEANLVPNDPNTNWDGIAKFNLNQVNANAGWDITTGSNTVTIAILDTGIQTTNLDFAGRFVSGYNSLDGSSNVEDVYGHGTHVAGIAAATGDNAYGIAGLNWFASIMPVKVLNDTGSGSTSSVANGITWAVDHGANVINMSLGSSFIQIPIQAAIQYAHDHGVVVVASAGNDGDTRYNYPASYDNVISVGAISSSNLVASFSNQNDKVDVVAPGVNIVSDALTGITRLMSGTSQAAPFVSGLVSLLFGMSKFNHNPDAIEEAIKNSATDLGDAGRDNVYGYGLINIAAAMNYPVVTVVPPESSPSEEPLEISQINTPLTILLETSPLAPGGQIAVTDPSLVQTGAWQLIPPGKLTDTPVLFTSTIGATVGFRFSGTRVTYLYPTNTNFGRVSIHIDGVEIAILSLYSTDLQWHNAWISPLLSEGVHTITITLLEGAAELEGFVVE